MIAAQHLDSLDPQQLRAALQSLLADVAAKDETIRAKDVLIAHFGERDR